MVVNSTILSTHVNCIFFRTNCINNGNSRIPELYADVDNAISFNRLLLRSVGIWPDPTIKKDEESTFSRYWFLFPVCLTICFLCAPQTVDLIMVWGNMDSMIENLAMVNIPAITAVLKILTFRYCREDVKPLVETYMADWKSVKGEAQQRVFLRNVKFSKTLTIVCFGQILVLASMYLYIQTTLNIRRGPTNRTLFYRSYFPYNAVESPFYELTTIGQNVAAALAATGYSAIDSCISTMVIHSCGQFTILQYDIRNLVNAAKRAKSNELNKKLVSIVTKHNKLIDFAMAIEHSFNKVLLIQILVCIIQLCFQGYQLLTMLSVEGNNSHFIRGSFLASYIFFITSHLFIYCMVGELLISKSVEFGYAVYESDWTALPSRQARILLLIMVRTKFPLVITAGKFCALSIELFSKILKTSCGYMSVLLTITS